MFYSYILKSKKDGKFYIGYTNNLERRFKEHNEDKVESTKHRRPLVLVYYEAYKSEEDAKIREEQLKYFGKAYSQLKRKIKKSIDNA